MVTRATANPDRDVVARVRRIFADDLQLAVDEHTDVIDGGILDSLAFVRLLVELEEEFGVVVDVAELDLDDFRSVTSVARLVARARNGGS